jgi:ribonuclease R
MEIDNQGRIVHSDIFESVIRSRIQMTYKKVNQILEENIVPEGYENYKDDLLLMNEVSDLLRKKMNNRGYIDFDIDEGKIIVNEKGEAIDVVLRERGTGEKLIENFMIAANEAVAETFNFASMPLIYRVHGEPSEEKMLTFFRLLYVLKYKIQTNTKKLTPKTIQQVLLELKDKKEFYVLSNQLLRSMQKAEYSANNIGHFGLASKYYCHFTSPIRRYPDLMVHRAIKKCLLNENINLEVVNSFEKRLPAIAEHSSLKERVSVDCERDVDKMKKAEYMEKHIGEEYEGVITGVTNFGFFVQLPNSVEGLVKVEDLKDDFYRYDESTFSLVGDHKKNKYTLGDEVRVKAIAASKLTSTVDFEII